MWNHSVSAASDNSFLLMQALARNGGEKSDLDFNSGRSRIKIANLGMLCVSLFNRSGCYSKNSRLPPNFSHSTHSNTTQICATCC